MIHYDIYHEIELIKVVTNYISEIIRFQLEMA